MKESVMKKLFNPRLMLIASMAIFGTLGPFVRNIPVSSGELAFYRASFRWGFYFDTSDAMHFTLTESSMEDFTDDPYALRKVYTYIGE